MSKPSASLLSEMGDKYIGTPYAKMDCQALVEQMLRDVGISLNLPGANAWYRKMTWAGSPEECKRTFGRIPVGAFLYILKQDGGEPGKYKADGLGNASHIGVYIARQDGAINSSKTRGGVCYSKFSGKSISGGWNRIGLWDRLSYGNDIDKKIGGSDPVRAIITSDNGGPVRVRTSPGGDTITKLPVGTQVEVITSGPEWSVIKYPGGSGYIMTSFLGAEGAPDPDGSGTVDLITVQLPGSTIQLTMSTDQATALRDALVAKVGRG